MALASMVCCWHCQRRWCIVDIVGIEGGVSVRVAREGEGGRRERGHFRFFAHFNDPKLEPSFLKCGLRLSLYIYICIFIYLMNI